MKKYHYSLIVFYLLNNSLLDANVNSFNAESINTVLQGGAGYLYPYPEQCTKILEEFAEYAANFTLCSILNAKPIRLCENCIEHYVNFSNKYKELLDTVVNETSCQTLYLSQDRFDVILEYHDHILIVWDKGHCNGCSDNNNVPNECSDIIDCFDFSEGIPRLSNNTIRFNKMAKNTMDCISSNIDPTTNNTDEVCRRCKQSYLSLNDFYGSLSKDSIGVDSVCMDTVDLMNTTRSIWSKNLHCCELRKSPQLIFLCCTAIISLLPLLYYVVVRFCGPIRDLPNVLKQSRFQQSFLRSMQGRVN